MKFLSFLLALSMILVSTTAYAHNPNPSSHMKRQWRKIVKIHANRADGRGVILASGFPIDASHIMTAGHFCAGVKSKMDSGEVNKTFYITHLNDNDELIVIEGGEIVKFEFSENTDLCLIHRPKHGIRPVDVVVDYYSKLQVGDKVYTVGAPLGVMNIVTDGYVAAKYTENMPAKILNNKLLVSSPITGGNSGGVVFNSKGQVIGVSVMVHAMYPHIAFGVTADSIWEFLLN